MKNTARSAQSAPEKQEATISIDEVAELYKNTMDKVKELTDKANGYKEQLLQYGTEHSEEWTKDGLPFDNGVKLIKKVTNKQFYNEDDIDVDWLENFINLASGNCVEIKFDQKKVAKARENNKAVGDLLNYIGYKVEPVETVAILLK